MARATFPSWLALALTLLLTTFAVGDGKAFPMVADPLADSASTTMPRQRAIIAWDGTEQRLAIDTAFTGEGTEFAWLVPLPSKPKILPATRGMFDTAAVLTAPRIEGGTNIGHLALASVFAVLFLIAVAVSHRSMAQAVGVFLCTVAVVMLLLPALGKSRGSIFNASTIRVLETGVAGLYETAVIEAQTAEDLLAWLTDNGYGVPAGVGPVVQDYLNRGWCFAAARIGVEHAAQGEHRAHPLEFRFPVEQPVYPMALTAVGNSDIELELFVFADGSARADGLRRACSLPCVVAPDYEEHVFGFVRPKRPVIVSHPRLVELAGSAVTLTRLHGVLNPTQQQRDIEIDISAFAMHDPELWTREARTSHAVTAGIMVSLVGGFLFLVARVARHTADSPLNRRILGGLGASVVMGALVSGFHMVTKTVYDGQAVKGSRVAFAGQTLRDIGRFLPDEVEAKGLTTEAEVRALIVGYGPEEYWESIREGDGPLHYRFEPGETEASLWFVWHDAIGGEYRSEITLAIDSADESR